jgi:putative transposase
MQRVLDPFRFLLISVAGWMNQQQQFALDYLREENRVLKEQLGGKRLRFNDDRKLIAQKYDGTEHRSPGRPRTAGEIEALVVRMAEENRDWATGVSKAHYPTWGTNLPEVR